MECLKKKNLHIRKKWDDVFKVLKEKKLLTRILHSAKLLLRNRQKNFFNTQNTEALCHHQNTGVTLQGTLAGPTLGAKG